MPQLNNLNNCFLRVCHTRDVKMDHKDHDYEDYGDVSDGPKEPDSHEYENSDEEGNNSSSFEAEHQSMV